MSSRNFFIVVVTLLCAQTALLSFEAAIHSPCTDEPSQLVAGMSQWATADSSLYRETGPLVRLLAAVPAVLVSDDFAWPEFDQRPGARPVYTITRQYLNENGADIFNYLFVGRLVIIQFSLLGGFVCFLWARDLWGVEAGIFSLAMWVISPHVLGHGWLIMTDIPGAALYVTASYLWWQWNQNPSLFKVLQFGFVVGLLLLTKGSFLISFATWLLTWVVALVHRRSIPTSGNLLQIVVAFVFSLYVLNAAYLFDGSFRRLDSYDFVSLSLGGDAVASGEKWGNRFVDKLIGNVPVPLPQHFVLGIDVQKGYFDRGLSSYFGGEWSERGWWWYYLVAFALKSPLATLTLVTLAGIAGVRTLGNPNSRYKGMFLIVPPLVMFVLISGQTGFSKNLRYAYPI